MAVGFDSTAKSGLSTTASPFTVSLNVNITPSGVIVFVITPTDVDNLVSVTYGATNVPVPQVATVAISAVSELGRVHCCFLGSGIPADDPATITINRVGTTGMRAMVASVFGSLNTEVYLPGMVTMNTMGTTAVASVDDGSPGTSSMRFCGGFHGDVSAAVHSASSTLLQSDTLASGAALLIRETTGGQGARNCGLTSAASDEKALIHIAVREVAAAAATGPIIPKVPAGSGAVRL